VVPASKLAPAERFRAVFEELDVRARASCPRPRGRRASPAAAAARARAALAGVRRQPITSPCARRAAEA